MTCEKSFVVTSWRLWGHGKAKDVPTVVQTKFQVYPDAYGPYLVRKSASDVADASDASVGVQGVQEAGNFIQNLIPTSPV